MNLEESIRVYESITKEKFRPKHKKSLVLYYEQIDRARQDHILRHKIQGMAEANLEVRQKLKKYYDEKMPPDPSDPFLFVP